MQSKQIIEELISSGNFEEAISALDHNIENDSDNAQWWYLRGKTYWRMGCRSEAIFNYEEAAHLDVKSPAVHALNMARDVMDFFNHDILNP